MVNFWIVSIATLIVAIGCCIINNAQYTLLKHLIEWLKIVVKKKLVNSGEPDKARMISTEDVPKLEKWFNECQNYGLINLFALLSSIGFIISGAIYHDQSLIISSLSAIFFATNIFFLPIALVRLNKAISINNNYMMLMEAFEQAEKNGPLATNKV